MTAEEAIPQVINKSFGRSDGISHMAADLCVVEGKGGVAFVSGIEEAVIGEVEVIEAKKKTQAVVFGRQWYGLVGVFGIIFPAEGQVGGRG